MTAEAPLTDYKGKCSLHIPMLEIVGTPRSGRRPMGKAKLDKEERKRRNEWRKTIVQAVRDYGEEHGVEEGLFPIRSECNLYVTFSLDGAPDSEGDSRYQRLDLDNLLKPLQDTLKGIVIEDDRLFKGVKVRKEPVRAGGKEKVVLSLITTKTFTIHKVEEKPGDTFIKYWKSPTQVITATDEDGREGVFIDHVPNVFLRDEHEKKLQYQDVVPGYDWQVHVGKKVDGCMVFKRQHHLTEEAHRNRNAPGKLRNFFWLHKWSW